MSKKRNVILERVVVSGYAAEGKSVARVDGKVVFVEDAVPGDVVDVRLAKNKKDWAEGRAVYVHEYSNLRIQPFCEHFGVCGGCQWQMLPYHQQLSYKQAQVIETFRRIGKIAFPNPHEIQGADHTTFYRNKIEYTFSNKQYLTTQQIQDPSISAMHNVAGYHAPGIFDKVIDIQTCYLQQEPTNRIRHAVKNFGIERGFTFYDVREHRGFLRTMQLRICRSGEIMVNIVLGEKRDDDIHQLVKFIDREFPEITTLLYTINTKWNDSLHDLTPTIYTGAGYVTEQLGNYHFRIGPKSFFQTNTFQAEKLYAITKNFAELKGSETVYDLYCGTGSIGIFLSDQAGQVVGIETVREAVEDARQNASINRVKHAEFVCGDVSAWSEAMDKFGMADVVVVDPPRAGLTPALIDQILNVQAPRIVYVSCNPATQARDVHMLAGKYDVTRMQAVDMFPHTHHIENVVQLTLRT